MPATELEEGKAMIDQIHRLVLRVTDLAAAATFYERALGVPVERLEDRCRFRAGATGVVSTRRTSESPEVRPAGSRLATPRRTWR
jgi:catechol 2,3-dioxygenase-like lactoylglutathione lyase family enzyme